MKLLIALGTAALLTAACTAGASSGSGGSSVKTTNTLHLMSGSNAAAGPAGADAPGDLDVNRVNPLIGKAGNHPAPQVQAAPIAPAAAQAPAVIQDRCNGGIENPPAAGNRAAPAPGKGLQLPACMPQ